MKETTKTAILNAISEGISESTDLKEIEMLTDLRFELEQFYKHQERIERNTKVVTDMFKTIGNCFDPNKIKKELDELTIKPNKN